MPGGQFGERFKVWFLAFSTTLKQSPFFGLGIGSWALAGVRTAQSSVPEPLGWIWVHNEYLQAFFEMGAFGIIILFHFIRDRFREARKCFYSYEYQAIFCGFLGVLLVSILHFPFHIARLAIPALFIMAICQAWYEERKNLEEEFNEKAIDDVPHSTICA
jgi:O-antigen ligase